MHFIKLVALEEPNTVYTVNPLAIASYKRMGDGVEGCQITLLSDRHLYVADPIHELDHKLNQAL